MGASLWPLAKCGNIALVLALIPQCSESRQSAGPEPAPATAAKPIDIDRHAIAGDSYYLQPLIAGRYHQVRLIVAVRPSGEREAEGRPCTLVLDPNECELNEYGDVQRSTRINPTLVHCRAAKVRTDDPAGEGRVLYEIRGTDELAGLVWLSVDGRTGQPLALVVGRDPGARRIVPFRPRLRPVPQAMPRPDTTPAKAAQEGGHLPH
jgi:hypothetical protein